MFSLPYIYGTLFLQDGDGFRTFRIGTHGKRSIEASEALRMYLYRSPIERLYHRMEVTDGYIFISDDIYSEDERESVQKTGFVLALKGWGRILAWAEKAGVLSSLGISSVYGTQVLVSTKMLQPLYLKDQSAGTAKPVSFYAETDMTADRSYLICESSLNRLDADGYPSYKSDDDDGHREGTAYRCVACYNGTVSYIPSFTNGSGTAGHTYVHDMEASPADDAGYSDAEDSRRLLTFYRTTPGTAGNVLYMSFTCASLLRALVWVCSETGGMFPVWVGEYTEAKPDIVMQRVTESDLEYLSSAYA